MVATERFGGALARFHALLGPRPGRFEFAFRLALVCALVTLVTETYATPEPALTAYVTFFVMRPGRSESVVAGLAMLVLISIVIGAVILLARVVIDDPLARVAAMATLSFCLLFAASASKLRPVGNIIGMIIAYVLALLGSIQIGELATRGLLYTWLFFAIPVSLSIAVNLLFGPPPRRLVERALAERLELAGRVLRGEGPAAREALEEALGEGTHELSTALTLAAAERSCSAAHLDALRQASDSITPILLLVDVVDRTPGIPTLVRHRIGEALDEMAAILRSGRYPIDIDLGPIAHEDVGGDSLAALARLKDAIEAFTRSPPREGAAPEAAAKTGFFAADAFTSQDHTRYALKTTLAAMFCYVLYSLLDWPGIHTALITCYIVALHSTAETVEKLTLRIGGCLVGAAAGIAAILWLTPTLTSIGGLMIVVFLSALASGWVAAGGPRIAYAGFQMVFAFFLCVLQGPGPEFDLVIARDRVIGILLGNLVVYAVFTNLWPVSVAARVDPAIAALLRSLATMLTTPFRSTRRKLAAAAAAALGAIDTDIDLVGYEPTPLRPAASWLEDRRKVLRHMGDLLGLLWVRADADEQRSDIAGRLEALARTAEGRFGESSPEAPLALGLEQLERELAPLPTRVTGHAPA